MDYTKTLRNITRKDDHLVGVRAVKLAVLHEQRVLIPLSLVVTSHALDRFLEDNQLQARLKEVSELQQEEKAADQEIQGLFTAASLPEDIAEEFGEAYESLSVSDEPGATALVKKTEEPSLLLIPSPDYAQDPEVSRKVIRTRPGKQAFLEGLRQCWALLYAAKEDTYRDESGIYSFKAGVIVQRMLDEDVSGEAYLRDDEDILVKAYYGLYDPENESEKDQFVVSRNYINIIAAKVVHQDFKLVRDDESVIQYPLKERGSHQKANDKEVIELARIGKRAAQALDQRLKCILGMKRGKAYLFFCDGLLEGGEVRQEAVAAQEVQGAEEGAAGFAREEGEEESGGMVRQPDSEVQAASATEPFEITLEPVPAQRTREEAEDSFIINIADEPAEQISVDEGVDRQEILDNSVKEFNKLVLNSSMVITSAVAEQYQALFSAEPGELRQMVAALKSKITIPYEQEIFLIEELKDKFLNDPGSITLQEIQFCLDIAQKFIREFR